MDAAYLKAAHPEPFTILSKKLKPFCLGHEILFQRFKNKFSIESEEKPGLADLMTGVFICSQRFSHDVSLNNFSIPLRVRLFTGLTGPSYIEKAYHLFHSYIAAHTEIPEFYVCGENEPRDTGTPTVQAVKVSLMSNLGLSEDEALNTPLSLAFWNHFAWLEGQGSIQIIDEAEKDRQRQIKNLESVVEEMGRKLFPNGFPQEAFSA